jgi:hypothetical protein
MIYVLRHSDPSFTGFMAGVGFDRGLGSTSSRTDALRLLDMGCTIEAGSPGGAPPSLSTELEEKKKEEAGAKRRKEAEEKVEQTPEWAAAKKAKQGGRRRRTL